MTEVARLRNQGDDYRALIDSTAAATGIRAAYIEKDYWVTELLRSVTAPPLPEGVTVIFKGGTSLSKAYNLIQRFSEDIDILLDGPPWMSIGARDRVLKELGRRAGEDLGLAVTGLEKDRGVKRNFGYEYPRVHAAEVISPRLRLEMGFRGGPQPNSAMEVRSYIAGHSAAKFQLGPETFEEFAPVTVAVLAPERTLVEKLMCLEAAARAADLGDASDLTRGVRHYYDVGLLLSNDSVVDGIAAFHGGIAGLVADINEKSMTHGFGTVARPAAGFSESPAFETGRPWMADVRRQYDESLPQLVWGRCPTIDDCLKVVEERRLDL